jgi:hypothetical protein
MFTAFSTPYVTAVVLHDRALADQPAPRRYRDPLAGRSRVRR